MGNLTKTSNRSVFLTMLVSSVVLLLAALIGFYYTTYTIGLARIPGQGGASGGCDPLLGRNAEPARWNMAPVADPWVINFLSGIAMTVVLSILHARFVWFPFEPVGFTLAISKASIPWGIWSSALVAWVIKTITLRVSGSKAYENFGVPVATGFISGYMAVHIIGTIVAHVKFFFPF